MSRGKVRGPYQLVLVPKTVRRLDQPFLIIRRLREKNFIGGGNWSLLLLARKHFVLIPYN
jgi:hypothetical protein